MKKNDQTRETIRRKLKKSNRNMTAVLAVGFLILITVGAVLLGVYVIFFEPKVEKRLKAEKEALAAASAVAETGAEVTDEVAEIVTGETAEPTPENNEKTSSEENSENG